VRTNSQLLLPLLLPARILYQHHKYGYLSSAVTFISRAATGRFRSIFNTSLLPDKCLPARKPLIATITKYPSKTPFRKPITTRNLSPQPFTISTQSRVGQIFPPDLKFVVCKFIKDIAGTAVFFVSQGLDLIFPSIRCGERTAKLVVMGVIDWVVAIAAIDDTRKMAETVGGVFDRFALVRVR